MPASRQISIRRAASATSVSPHALKNSLAPPKVAAPKLRAETLRPEPPSSLYSMAFGCGTGDQDAGLESVEIACSSVTLKPQLNGCTSSSGMQAARSGNDMKKTPSKTDWDHVLAYKEADRIPYEPEDGPYDPNDADATRAWLERADLIRNGKVVR